jgi:hypothetical protein
MIPGHEKKTANIPSQRIEPELLDAIKDYSYVNDITFSQAVHDLLESAVFGVHKKVERIEKNINKNNG